MDNFLVRFMVITFISIDRRVGVFYQQSKTAAMPVCDIRLLFLAIKTMQAVAGTSCLERRRSLLMTLTIIPQ